MNQPASLLLIVGTIALSISIVQASSPKPGASSGKSIEDRAEAAQNKLKDIESAISRLNSKKTCDSDSQCEILEMGSRLCGGPSKYLVVSTANPKNYSQIKAKITEYTKAEEQLNLLENQVGCTPSPELPKPICKENLCH